MKPLTLTLLSLLSLPSSAQVWQLGSSCGFNGCGDVRTDSLPEFCKAMEAGENTPNGNHVGALIGIEISQLPEPYWSEQVAVGQCVFSHPYRTTISAINRDISKCPEGTVFDKKAASCVEKEDRNKCKVGNPMEVSTGIKAQTERDFTYTLGNGKKIYLSRHYRTKNNLFTNSYQNQIYGGFWTFSFSDTLSRSDFTYLPNSFSYQSVQIFNDQRYGVVFVNENNQGWENRNSGQEKLQYSNNQWTLYLPDGSIKIFNDDGKLIRFTDPQKTSIDIFYRTDLATNSQYTDIRWNNALLFSYRYNSGNLIAAYDGQQSPIASYEYDSLGNLTTVTYPDQTQRKYLYENETYKKSLTGIIDENNTRFATWFYDSLGRAISSDHSGNDKTTLDFDENFVTVTNPLNKKTVYHYEQIANTRRVSTIEGQASANCIAANKNYTYTTEGWISSKTDWKGNITTYIYNTLGQEISRTEAAGTPNQRTTTTEWHPTLQVKTKVTDPEKETTYSYNENGLLSTVTQKPAH